MSDWLIHSGRVIDPLGQIDTSANIHIHQGRIQAIAPGLEIPGIPQIDASGLVVAPGLVDFCARLREPGAEYKATIASESQAAAAGGITSLCIPPDTNPVIDTPAVVELIEQRAQQTNYRTKLYCLGALTRKLLGEQLSEMAALRRAGCVGVSNGYAPIKDTLTRLRCLQYAKSFQLTVHLHCEEASLAKHGCAHDSTALAQLGLQGIPTIAETIALARDLLLLEQTQAQAHICRLSSVESAQLIASAQAQGLDISADVAAHQLHLTDRSLSSYDSNLHLRPPLRSEQDRQGLIDHLRQGTISIICSDHQPHEAAAKFAPFPESEPGMSALETLLPLTLSASKRANLSLAQSIALITANPAQRLGINAGHLAVGAHADICIFDPEYKWTPEQHWHSKGRNSHFLNTELTGKVYHTLVNGERVYTRTS